MQNHSENLSSADKTEFVIVFSGGKRITITDTLEGIVEAILLSETLKKYTPLKIIIGERVMCYNNNLFASFQQGATHYSELIEATECDEVYRNINDIHVGEITVDAGALWMLNGKELTWVNDDEFLTYPLTERIFEIAQ